MIRVWKTQRRWAVLLLLGALVLYGCDVGINPLLFDGSPLEKEFQINTEGTSFSQSGEVDLNTAIKDISKKIDSIKVFNITVRVENTGSTPAGTTFSGIASFVGDTLATMTNVSLSTLSTERSIFNTTGLAFNETGLGALRAAVEDAVLNPSTPHPRTFSVGVTSSDSPVQVTIHLKVYTQIYTTP